VPARSASSRARETKEAAVGQCYNSVVVNAPVEKVWARIRDFHDLSWAEGMGLKVDAVGDRGSKIGAKRVINGAFHETLVAFDEAARTFSYSIDDGPGPVAKDAVRNYRGTVRLLPVTADNATFVEWTSDYESPNEPAVSDFCNPIYQSALKGLRQHFS
jgi:hypothetical protein